MHTQDRRNMTLGGMHVHDNRVRVRSGRVPRVARAAGVRPLRALRDGTIVGRCATIIGFMTSLGPKEQIGACPVSCL